MEDTIHTSSFLGIVFGEKIIITEQGDKLLVMIPSSLGQDWVLESYSLMKDEYRSYLPKMNKIEVFELERPLNTDKIRFNISLIYSPVIQK